MPKRSHLAAQLEFGSKTLITLRQGSDDATGEETARSETPTQAPAHPLKLVVVHLFTRFFSPSIANLGQFSHPWL